MKKRVNTVSALSLLMATVMLVGCNAFTQNYQGERFTVMPHAQLVDTPPKNARKIGESRFLSYEDIKPTDAVKTAEGVGANFVTYQRIDLGERRNSEGTTMMVSTGPGGSPMAVNLPVPVTRKWYEYVADFYRAEDDSES
jgi:hypothetical protein